MSWFFLVSTVSVGTRKLYRKVILVLTFRWGDDILFVLQLVYRYGVRMNTITVSPKFQIVIPQRIRKSLGLEPGHKVQAILYENRIELIPIQPMRSMRGFLKGIDTSIEREADRV